MSRIKRNLFSIGGAALALSVIGFAGFHYFSGAKRDSGPLVQTSADVLPATSRPAAPETHRPAAAASEIAKLTLHLRAVKLTDAAADTDTSIAYALERELKASPLFDANETKLGAEIKTDQDTDTFTFDVTLALKRPIKMSDEDQVARDEMPAPGARHASRLTRYNL